MYVCLFARRILPTHTHTATQICAPVGNKLQMRTYTTLFSISCKAVKSSQFAKLQ